ncbi:MAG: FecR domain-containing protein [Armatimonadetes bacterium]|nr:FecR domain-containing protein [Armatimonadota bacterium]MDE2206788.1 FecR domain-containing protein [Armatimonadota bacterium]
MKRRVQFGRIGLLAALLGAASLSATAVSAQTAYDPSAAGTDASIGASDTTSQGPVRLARFSAIDGQVSWRPDAGQSWSDASINQPLRQGSQIWVSGSARAEVQFDDGSALRLGNGAVITLQTLYSDSQGEFTELSLQNGSAELHVSHQHSIYQVDSPLASVKADGPVGFRVNAGQAVGVAVYSGRAQVQGQQGTSWVDASQYLYIQDASSQFEVSPLPAQDSFDTWNAQRDEQLYAPNQGDSYLPPDVALVAGNLGDYGVWQEDSQWGHVWVPRVGRRDWRPYSDGHWAWVDPFGWTWVSNEPWGWAPYHYGTWIDEPYGWAWCPGPETQYWSPAVVGFSVCDGGVAWAPLSPWEVRYPVSLSIGFGGGDWGAFFSIGGAGVYYPGYGGYCNPSPWNNGFLNRRRFSGVTDAGFRGGSNLPGNPVFMHGVNFVPRNALRAPGATFATASSFRGGGSFTRLPKGDVGYFQRGKIPAPGASGNPFSGPSSVQPGSDSFNGGGGFSNPGFGPGPLVLNRPVIGARLPQAVRSFAPAAGAVKVVRTSRSSNFAAPVVRGSRSGSVGSNFGQPATAPRRVGNPASGRGSFGFGGSAPRQTQRGGQNPSPFGSFRSQPAAPRPGTSVAPPGFAGRSGSTGSFSRPPSFGGQSGSVADRVARARAAFGLNGSSGGSVGRNSPPQWQGHFGGPPADWSSHSGSAPRSPFTGGNAGTGRSGFGTAPSQPFGGSGRQQPTYRSNPFVPRYQPSQPAYRPPVYRPSQPSYRPPVWQPSQPSYRPPVYRPSQPQFRPQQPRYQPSRPTYHAPPVHFSGGGGSRGGGGSHGGGKHGK